MINWIRKKLYQREQKQINKQFKKEGLTLEVLHRQAILNSKRHKHNITNGDYKQ